MLAGYRGGRTIAKDEATNTSRMAKLIKVITTRGTFSRRNIVDPTESLESNNVEAGKFRRSAT
jgi:hypothetical protein